MTKAKLQKDKSNSTVVKFVVVFSFLVFSPSCKNASREKSYKGSGIDAPTTTEKTQTIERITQEINEMNHREVKMHFNADLAEKSRFFVKGETVSIILNYEDEAFDRGYKLEWSNEKDQVVALKRTSTDTKRPSDFVEIDVK